MVELIIVACSILHGASCKEHKLSFIAQPGEISAWACAKYGQHEASKWALEHPNWRISRFKCGRPSTHAKA
jgi:hypothetical protein